MAHVITKIKRPRSELIQKFSKIDVATVYEASGRKGAVDPAIKPVSPGVRICGSAYTVQCAPNDNLMLHKALEKAQSGDVIVASVGGHYEAGYWGEMMAISAMERGLGGLAIDGCVRDSAQISSMGFQLFCRGFCIRGTTKATLGTVNHPIVFGDVIVNPGDLVLGNDDGIVVVAFDECSKVLEKAINRTQDEEKKSEMLKSGMSSMELNKLDKVFSSLGLGED